MRPCVFVACSRERLELSYAIQEELEYEAEVTLWPQSSVKPSGYTLDHLLEVLHHFDFGVFLLTPDDETDIRGEKFKVTRDNVILELGMFVGRLGRDRCFILSPRGETKLRIPSDILGIETLSFDNNRSDGNWRAALGPAVNRIRKAIRKHGNLGLPKEPELIPPQRKQGVSKIERDQLETNISKVTESLGKSDQSCLLMIDIDRFTAINRWYGSEIGDQIIHEIYEIILRFFEGRFVCRLGGDQFVVCLVGTSATKAMDEAGQLVQEIKQFDWPNFAPNLFVTVSIGVAPFKHGRDIDEWIVRAIHGVLNAKKAGGARVSKGPTDIPYYLRVRYELMLS
jgi:diguanylate cyclase (GGDEF)-like protein